MYKVYNGVTIDQAAVDADPHLKNSSYNRFIGCTFSGTISGVNFFGAAFTNTNVFTGAVFTFCNFGNINPEGGGWNPSQHGATFTRCGTGTPLGGVDYGERAHIPLCVTPSFMVTVPVANVLTGTWDETVIHF